MVAPLQNRKKTTNKLIDNQTIICLCGSRTFVYLYHYRSAAYQYKYECICCHQGLFGKHVHCLGPCLYIRSLAIIPCIWSWYIKLFQFSHLQSLHQPSGSKKQYMVVASYQRNTHGELYMKRIPLHFENESYSKMDKTFKTAYQNGNIKGLKRKFANNTYVHTELQFLFTERGRDFITDAVMNGEVIFIYSFYIPCAGIKNCINECSYNLAEFVANYDTYGLPKKPTVIIGYDQCFERTDASKSKMWLDSEDIPYIQLPGSKTSVTWPSWDILRPVKKLLKSPCNQVLNTPFSFPMSPILLP